MAKLKFAFIGTGYMANEYAKVLKNGFSRRSEIVAAINKSSDSVKAFTKKFKVSKHYSELKEMMIYAKPDVVIVCVNELSTYGVLKELSLYPCICLIEKPVGINHVESLKILKLKKNKKFFPFVALNRREFSSVKKAVNLISKDKSPRIINIFDQESSLVAKKSGQPDKVVKNWMYANSIHIIDFINIFARGKINKIKKVERNNIFKEGIFSCILSHDSGDKVFYNCIWNRPSPWSVQVSTKKYFVELKPLENVSFLTNKNRKWNFLKSSTLDINYKPGIYSLINEIFRFKKIKKTNLKDLKYSHQLMKLIRNIYFD